MMNKENKRIPIETEFKVYKNDNSTGDTMMTKTISEGKKNIHQNVMLNIVRSSLVRYQEAYDFLMKNKDEVQEKLIGKGTLGEVLSREYEQAINPVLEGLTQNITYSKDQESELINKLKELGDEKNAN